MEVMRSVSRISSIVMAGGIVQMARMRRIVLLARRMNTHVKETVGFVTQYLTAVITRRTVQMAQMKKTALLASQETSIVGQICASLRLGAVMAKKTARMEVMNITAW